MPQVSMPQSSLRTAQAVALCAAVGVSGSACSGPATASDALVIGVDSASTEQAVLGEIYRSGLGSRGVSADVEQVELTGQTDIVDALRAGDVDLVIACSGKLLESLYPQRAREIESELRDAEVKVSDKAELSKTIYKEAIGSLPGNLMSVDPSPAQGCVSSEDEGHDETNLPQNIVALFRASELSSYKSYQINLVGRELNTSSLAEMVQEAEDGRPVHEVVLERSWA